MKTIFHFNCVVCGAHPKEVSLDKFNWPLPAEKRQELLGVVKGILGYILKATLYEEPFRRAVADLKETLPGIPVERLNDYEGLNTVFVVDCPLCDTPRGPRPFDRYFSAWFESSRLGSVQVGNLLFEMKILSERDSTLNSLVQNYEACLAALDSSRCKCGRPGYLNGGWCRWCMDEGEGPGSFGDLLLPVRGGPTPCRELDPPDR